MGSRLRQFGQTRMKAFGAVVMGVLLLSSSREPVAAPVQPARSFPAVTYDGTRRDVVLFGGLAAGATIYGDIWTWDGSHWTQRTSASQPPARFGASMVYDPGAQGRAA